MEHNEYAGELVMDAKPICAVIVALCVAVVAAQADSLELKNGSLIKGKFMGGTQANITFQVGSSVQSYDVADIRSLRFDSEAQGTSPSIPSKQPVAPSAEKDEVATASPSVTIPAGTRISVRTIDSIDSTKNQVGYRFQASLEEPLWVDGNMVVPKDADVYGRLEESKETGTFTGRSELKLELTGIVVHGQTVPLVTGEYEVSGKSKGESTAKRTVGGAAIGSIIGALSGGGKGAAIGAGTGTGVGAGSEIITEGDQVKIPSETLLDFTLQLSVTIPQHAA
ncbi:MAG: hypothetical protein WCC99_08810 [Candidatus Sulfotelmatobacter sp.]